MFELLVWQCGCNGGSNRHNHSRGKTHKREWDCFCRSAANRKVFPGSLSSNFMTNKVQLFGLWLDSDRDWKETEAAVQRMSRTDNMTRSQWQAVQGKELRKAYSEAKFIALIQKRKAAGLYYVDSDFPEDDDDFWLFKVFLTRLKQGSRWMVCTVVAKSLSPFLAFGLGPNSKARKIVELNWMLCW